jgi:hypothetical protein
MVGPGPPRLLAGRLSLTDVRIVLGGEHAPPHGTGNQQRDLQSEDRVDDRQSHHVGRDQHLPQREQRQQDGGDLEVISWVGAGRPRRRLLDSW